MILAFDLATNTGVAVGRAGDKPALSTEVMGLSGEPHGTRFAQCMRMTKRLILQHSPDLIAVEEAIVSGAVGDANRAKMALGLRGAVFAIAHIHHIRCVEYPVQTIRKHFIGRGNLASEPAKVAVMSRCRLLGWRFSNDNESDAAAVWDLASARSRRSASLTPNGLFDHAGRKDQRRNGSPAQRRG